MTTKTFPASIWRNPIHFIASGFGVGALPWIPGTWGTLLAIPIYLALEAMLNPLGYLLVLIGLIIMGVWATGVTAKACGDTDPGFIVWDEIVGFLLAMFLAPNDWSWIWSAFILFRVFDILKPWPIKWIETKFTGGYGIVFDDLMAGLYVWIILQVVILFLFGLD